MKKRHIISRKNSLSINNTSSVILLIVLGLGLFPSPFLSSNLMAQVTPVLDSEHNATSVVEATTSGASTALKQFFENPAWEKISKVQDWLQQASQIVSAVLVNLKMTRQVIELEKDLWETFVRVEGHLNEADDFSEKWLYRKLLLELWGQKVRIFEVFDLATQQELGIIDDEGRIQLIQSVLEQAKSVKAGMRLLIRRSNRDLANYERAKREIQLFQALFNH